MTQVASGLAEADERIKDLFQRFSDCVEGRGRIIVVRGDVGTGKSASLHAFLHQLETHDAFVLKATCAPSERSVPFGALDQLLRSAPARTPELEHTLGLLDEGVLTVLLQDADGLDELPPPVNLLRRTWQLLCDLAAHRPVVMAVDDVQHIDIPSLRCLLHFARRLASVPMLLVINERTGSFDQHVQLLQEILNHPHCEWIACEPLSEDGVRQYLRAHRNPAPPARHVAIFHEVSGGYPARLGALLQDNADRLGEPVAGAVYGRTIVASLRRRGPRVLRLAQALSLFETPVEARPLGEVLDLPPDSVRQMLAELTTACVLRGSEFCQEAARSAVMTEMTPEERHDLHVRIAKALDRAGAPAQAIARHLLKAAQAALGSWAVPILQDTAEQALAAGEVAEAIECLRLAVRQTTDDKTVVALTMRLAEIEWCHDPTVVARHFQPLLDRARLGALEPCQATVLSTFLLWHGRQEDAAEVRAWIADPCAVPSLSRVFPLAVTPETVPDGADPAWGRPPAPPEPGPQDASAEVDRFLERAGHTEPAEVTGVLMDLMCRDRLDDVLAWCDRLLDEGRPHRAPLWDALLTGLKAAVNVRSGDLRLALEQGRRALAILGVRGWGVAIGQPLASVLVAASIMGRFEEAAAVLALPVPSSMFDTPYGAHYLHGRGVHALATGRYMEAINTFERCGELLVAHGCDLPALIPWRSSMARAYLAIGRADRARVLAEEQLARVEPGQLRPLGVAMRVLAATSPLEDRPHTLHQAVDVLQRSGDRIELALAMSDLSQTHQALGDQEAARRLTRRVNRLAAQCGMRMPPSRPTPTAPTLSSATDLDGRLTEAEVRVASLAAEGKTNRQIATALFVTTSTVEQHLTSTYRKLRVAGRKDLPSVLFQFIHHSLPERLRT